MCKIRDNDKQALLAAFMYFFPQAEKLQNENIKLSMIEKRGKKFVVMSPRQKAKEMMQIFDEASSDVS